MKALQTQIIIHAEISKVWNVLMDFEAYPNWNPFIRSINGTKKIGEKLTVFIKPPDGNGMTFKPVILNLDPGKEFRWKGKLGIHGIFDGEHYFLLEHVDAGVTRFVHGEKFSGILVPLMGGLLEKTKIGFESMNESLKEQCEK